MSFIHFSRAMQHNNCTDSSQSPSILAQFYTPPSPRQPNNGNQISPSIEVIVIILAVAFFLSGCLHMLIRHLSWRVENRSASDAAGTSAPQQRVEGRLQQLLNMSDSGVEESLIESLPTFQYKAISKGGGFDCAICLCEFQAEDKLRVIPNCSHAFHMECIDTWLFCHSTCPLCRCSLLLPLPTPPIHIPFPTSDANPASEAETEAAEEETHIQQDSLEIVRRVSSFGAEGSPAPAVVTRMAVKLGKFTNTSGRHRGVPLTAGSSSERHIEVKRRCFSMGSYEYVIEESEMIHASVGVVPSWRPGGRRKRSISIGVGRHLRRPTKESVEIEEKELIAENGSHRWTDVELGGSRHGNKQAETEAEAERNRDGNGLKRMLSSVSWRFGDGNASAEISGRRSMSEVFGGRRR